MFRISSFLIALFTLLFVFGVPQAQAQDTTSPWGDRNSDITLEEDLASGGVYYPPAIFVDDLKLISIGSSNNIQGSLTLTSEAEETVGDIQYEIQLLSDAGVEPIGAPAREVEALEGVGSAVELVADNASIYHRQVSGTPITLTPGQKQGIQFTYQPPAVPEGEYRVRVQVVTSQGERLGWGDMNVRLSGSAASFVGLYAGLINLPEFPNEEIPPLSGPNVDAGSSFSLNGTAVNTQGSLVTVVPKLTVYDFEVTGEQVSSKTYDAISINANGEYQFTLPVVAPTESGVYHAELVMQDPNSGTTISPIAEYRWIVRGDAGRIISVRISELRMRAGEEVGVVLDFVGPGDSETELSGSFTIQIIDDQGVAGTYTQDGVTFNDSLGGGILSVVLDRDIVGVPRVSAVIKNNQGEELDSQKVDLSLDEQQIDDLVVSVETKATQRKTRAVGYIILFVILIIALVVFFLIKRKGKSAPDYVTMTLVFLGFSLLFGGVVYTARDASGFTLKSPHVEGRGTTARVFINNPRHNGTYDRENVPVSVSITWLNCSNRYSEGHAVAHYLKNGGKISTYNAPAGNEYVFVTYVRGSSGGWGGVYWYYETRSYSGTVNFVELAESALDTTFRLWGARSRGADVPLSGSTGSNWAHHAVAIHMNFNPVEVEEESLAVSKFVDKVGLRLEYVIRVENDGSKEVPNIQITDPIPHANLVFNAGASSSSCSQSGGNIVCSDATPLAIGATRDYDVVFNNVANTCGVLSNTAVVQGESSYTSNAATHDAESCLEITRHEKVDTGDADSLKIVVGVRNKDVSVKNNLKLVGTLGVVPVNPVIVYNDGASDSSCDQAGATVACTQASLAPDETLEFSVVYEGLTNQCVVVGNTAAASADGDGGVTDSVSNLYVGDVCTPLSCTASPATGGVGSSFTFTASGGVEPYTWPDASTGDSYSTTFNAAGSHNVLVQDGIDTNISCENVTVNEQTFTPGTFQEVE